MLVAGQSRSELTNLSRAPDPSLIAGLFYAKTNEDDPKIIRLDLEAWLEPAAKGIDELWVARAGDGEIASVAIRMPHGRKNEPYVDGRSYSQIEADSALD